ncbi:hypothetical protein [Ferruginibacter sp.]
MLKSKSALVLIVAASSITACSSNEIGNSKDVAQDKIYQHYSFSYNEGDANAELYCQFRFAGKNGTTLVLNSPAGVQFDGSNLPVDSSKYGGAYYRKYVEANKIYGSHSIVFNTIENKKLENSFSFEHFTLTGVPAAAAKSKPLVINFETAALKDNDYIELSTNNSDSSFTVTHTASDKGNFITVPAKELQRQKGKVLELSATLYRTIPLQQNTSEGGDISVRHTLKTVNLPLTQ